MPISATVISSKGGQNKADKLVDCENNKEINNKKLNVVNKSNDIVSDVDRAFAFNCKLKFKPLVEYVYGKKITLGWSDLIIDPDLRDEYCERYELDPRFINTNTNLIIENNLKINKIKSAKKEKSKKHLSKLIQMEHEPVIEKKTMMCADGISQSDVIIASNIHASNILITSMDKIIDEIKQIRSDVYLVLILGFPRSGKTTFTQELIKYWGQLGSNYTVQSIGEMPTRTRYRMTKNALESRISIILDGHCWQLRDQLIYKEYCMSNRIPIIYIQVNPNYEICKLFNQLHVEDSTDENCILYKNELYNIYNSGFVVPSIDIILDKYLIWKPQIIKKKSFKYRY